MRMAKARHKIEKIFYDLHLIGQKYANCIVSVKNSSLIGMQQDWQKDKHNLQKSFLHLTTDNFSLKSGVMLYSRRNFIIRIRSLLAYLEPLHKRFEFSFLIFVAYFFSIWATHFCEVYKLFSYSLTIRCWLFVEILRVFLIFVTDFFAK